jgi:hypothetical protein
MIWFIVIICEILLILFGVVIVLLSAELPTPIHPVVKPQQSPEPLDNPHIIGDNDYVDD